MPRKHEGEGSRGKRGPYAQRGMPTPDRSYRGEVPVLPPDIHERIGWKEQDIRFMQLKAADNPHDRVYPFVIARLTDELGALRALRDKKTWRRNG